MKYRFAHWLSHDLTFPLTRSLSPPLIQRRELPRTIPSPFGRGPG